MKMAIRLNVMVFCSLLGSVSGVGVSGVGSDSDPLVSRGSCAWGDPIGVCLEQGI